MSELICVAIIIFYFVNQHKKTKKLEAQKQAQIQLALAEQAAAHQALALATPKEQMMPSTFVLASDTQDQHPNTRPKTNTPDEKPLFFAAGSNIRIGQYPKKFMLSKTLCIYIPNFLATNTTIPTLLFLPPTTKKCTPISAPEQAQI